MKRVRGLWYFYYCDVWLLAGDSIEKSLDYASRFLGN